MNLKQLKALCEVVDRGYTISGAAQSLFRTQPSITRQIQELEKELGIELFVRKRSKILDMTPQGREVVAIARRMLDEARNMQRVSDELSQLAVGEFSIATTHTQARYVLPRVIRAFSERYPKVKVMLHQGNPVQVAQLTSSGEADCGIATETLASFPDLVTLPCYEWNRCVLIPRGHPLAKSTPLTLAALARYPIITYDFSFTGRTQINAAFEAEGLSPNVVLTALDADVIKTYVDLGMGVGIVAQMAYDPERDTQFQKLDASHLFAPSLTRLALRRGVFLRGYVYDFIAGFVPSLDRAAIDEGTKPAMKSYT